MITVFHEKHFIEANYSDYKMLINFGPKTQLKIILSALIQHLPHFETVFAFWADTISI
jgi:hypothetical protein